MNFSRKIILTVAIALVAGLSIACWSPDAPTQEKSQATKPPAAVEITDGKRSSADRKGEQMETVSAFPSLANDTPPEEQRSEDQRWCQAWALDNLKPHLYAEFAKLDPAKMDDLDRTVWRSRLPEVSLRKQTITSQLCWMYWAEPLSRANADRRNQKHEAECLRNLLQHVDSEWDKLASTAVRYGEPPAYQIPNQYVLVLKWLGTPGQELLEMDKPPYELFKRLYNEGYTQNPNMPAREQTAKLSDMYSEACQLYYPQLFYGYWIPSTTWPNESPSQLSKVEVAKIKRTQEGPLYLPRP